MQFGKYARIERERRFLLGQLPDELSSASPHTTIYDRYIHDTRFRLRQITTSDSKTVTCKLTQKYIHTPGNFASVVITNTYLTDLEYRTFAALAADELHKDRYRYITEGQQYAIDCFHGALAGLVLAEIEFSTDQDMSTFVPPTFVLADVTGEEAFTGGRLCGFTAAELQDVIERTRRR